ncbi:hypothetical protein WKI68_44350 [Streptomyces sp. MS1.HAVA.3]|uniref:Uncharacterized protein n=1 Tax=Streptomyces caledonius TaxID=3134107 RepID=A0ABU8UEW5_9ACTN
MTTAQLIDPLTGVPAHRVALPGGEPGRDTTPYTSAHGNAGRLPYSRSTGHASLSAARSSSTVVNPAGRPRSSPPSHSQGSEV